MSTDQWRRGNLALENSDIRFYYSVGGVTVQNVNCSTQNRPIKQQHYHLIKNMIEDKSTLMLELTEINLNRHKKCLYGVTFTM